MMFPSLNKREFGGQLEQYACTQLEQQGCKIICKNFECKLGEIDIIAQDQNNHQKHLVFVEVRYRQHQAFGGALASVDKNKQRKLINTANWYLQQHKLANKVACRFDVFAISGEPQKLVYQWIKDAFYAPC